MTSLAPVKECLKERRAFVPKSADWDYLTRAAWRYLEMHKDSVNATEWRPASD